MIGSRKTKLDEEAYKRDNYKCAKCYKGNAIEAHHIVPGIEKLSNLITLCHVCHKKEHKMSGCFKKGETYHQLPTSGRSNKNNRLGIKGVFWSTKRKMFEVQIKVKNKSMFLGRFNVLGDADDVYRVARTKYFGLA